MTMIEERRSIAAEPPPGYRFPVPPFPTGWFQVAYGDELKDGDVLPLEYFGQHLVLFRDGNGVARVLDAFCPHLGAHLGYGGVIEDGCIRCPFHAWRFDGDGACVEVPYAEKIPPQARLRSWPVSEKNGLIMVFHHIGGGPPLWELPDVKEYTDPSWTDYIRRRWKIRSHNQDMAENAVDSAHFKYVHGTPQQPKTRAEVDGHLFRVRSPVQYTTPNGAVEGWITSESHGFGFSLVRFAGIVDTMIASSVTPIDGEYVDVRFSFKVKKLGNEDVTSNVGRAFIKEIERQMGQDIPIWEHKVMKQPPVLCDGDGPIGLFRRWAKQFYIPEAMPGDLQLRADGGDVVDKPA
jgi:phenylpropionate dioxygenase-like ring-hydroxylating dioxygenase large terminal subunit